MIKEQTVVKITSGRYVNRTGIVREIFPAGELDIETIFAVNLTPNHVGQFKASELMEIAQGGEFA